MLGSVPEMPAGWYPDPERTMPLRWWDGQSWTAWQAETAEAGYPPPGPVETVAPVEPLSPVWARRALLGAGAALAAATGLGLWGHWLVREDREAAAASWPSALGLVRRGTGSTSLEAEPTGVVRWSTQMSAQLPQGWSLAEGKGLQSVLHANVVGFDRTPGWEDSAYWWPAAVLLGTFSTRTYLSSDLPTTAGVISQQMAALLYRNVPDLSHEPASAEPGPTVHGHPSGRATTTVHYRSQGGSQQAEVQHTVVDVAQEQGLLWTVVIPDRATEAQRQAQTTAWESLWLA